MQVQRSILSEYLEMFCQRTFSRKKGVLKRPISYEKECPQNHQHFLEDGVNSTTQHMVGPAIQVKATQYSVPT